MAVRYANHQFDISFEVNKPEKNSYPKKGFAFIFLTTQIHGVPGLKKGFVYERASNLMKVNTSHPKTSLLIIDD